MKKLVLGSLIAVISQTAGCVVTEDAVITANWSLKQEATGQIIPCPPGTTTAAVYSQPVDSSNRPVGSPIIDLFDCDDNSGRTLPLPPDVYQTWVELTSEGGGSVYARSISAFVDVLDSDKTFTTTILNDGGYFELDWDLVDASTNAPLECADISDNGGVGVVATSVANMSMFKDTTFDCEDHHGITKGLLQGAYTVSIDAMNRAGQSISPQSVVLTNRVIGERNTVTDLGTVTVPVE
ncbi:MAG: hypothetical protein JWP01_599 [Myxococcales bacterium]|nr:hypothetical protein [Myxococcales bacterium]